MSTELIADSYEYTECIVERLAISYMSFITHVELIHIVPYSNMQKV